MRASQRGVGLQVRYEGRFPSGPNGERLPAYSLAVACDVHGDGEARAAATRDMEKFMTPAPKREIEGWLAEMSVICARRGSEMVEEALRLEAYSSRLAMYPADVARAVTVGKRPMWKFWPAWSEIEADAERMAAPRRQMLAALRRGPEAQEPERAPRCTREQALDILRAKFPGIARETLETAFDAEAERQQEAAQ